MSNEIVVKGINDLITPEIRQTILDNGETFVSAINAAFKPFGVVFEQGLSLSAMVKKSPQYVALEKSGVKGATSGFMNKVKSTAKVCKLGEQITLDMIIRGHWARFNGTLSDKKTGGLKQTNISFMAPDVKASKLDDEMLREAKIHVIEAESAAKDLELARLRDLLQTHDISVEITPIA